MNPFRDFLLVAIGGAIGAMTRYAIGLGAQTLLGKQFAWGTLVANIVGCFLVGIIGQRVFALETAQEHAPAHFLRVAIMVGFLGGLTTFSAFGWESMSRLVDKQAGAQLVGLVNIAANLLLGLVAVWVGMQVGKAS